MRRFLAATLPALALLGPPAAFGHDPVPLAIGAKAPEFKLPGVDGKDHKLGEYAAAKVLVVCFTCNHCPTAQAYEARVARLVADYKDKGVAVVAISPNDPKAVSLAELGYSDLGDSFDEMKLRAKDGNYNYPYLYDGETQETAKAYGVLATPHIFIFDKDRKLRFQGRFDDEEVKPPTSHDTINAVNALLAGKPVPVATTRVQGCSTKWSDKRADTLKAIAKWDAEPVELKSADAAAVSKLLANDSKKYLLLGVWSSESQPAVAILDDLVTINRMYRGRPFEMATLSLDGPEKRDETLKVLRKNHASARNYLFQGSDRETIVDAIDKEWTGSGPYTLLIAPGGKVVYQKAGAFDALELKRAIVGQLGRTY
ncbi:redoxin domain-containing protein [Isosphaeraceae bacterium EP7]